MPKQTTLIPKAVISRIFKQIGAPRVADKALTRVVEILTNHAEKIGAMAIEIAKHRGSRTVNEGDVRIALKGR